MSVEFRIIGAKETVEKLNKLGSEDIEKARKKWLDESAILVEGEAKKEAPVDKGILRKHIRSKVMGEYAVIYNNVAYALAVHEGLEPYTIHAKPGKALRWKGTEHPVKKVNHPGIKANPFFTRSLENTKEKITQRLGEIVDTLAQKRMQG